MAEALCMARDKLAVEWFIIQMKALQIAPGHRSYLAEATPEITEAACRLIQPHRIPAEARMNTIIVRGEDLQHTRARTTEIPPHVQAHGAMVPTQTPGT